MKHEDRLKCAIAILNNYLFLRMCRPRMKDAITVAILSMNKELEGME